MVNPKVLCVDSLVTHVRTVKSKYSEGKNNKRKEKKRRKKSKDGNGRAANCNAALKYISNRTFMQKERNKR